MNFRTLCACAWFGVSLAGCGLIPDVAETTSVPFSTKGDCSTDKVVVKLTDNPDFAANKDHISGFSLTGARLTVTSVGSDNTAAAITGTATLSSGGKAVSFPYSGTLAVGTVISLVIDQAAAQDVADAANQAPYEITVDTVNTPTGATAAPVCDFKFTVAFDYAVQIAVL
jgi:hypothetical protein